MYIVYVFLFTFNKRWQQRNINVHPYPPLLSVRTGKNKNKCFVKISYTNMYTTIFTRRFPEVQCGLFRHPPLHPCLGTGRLYYSTRTQARTTKSTKTLMDVYVRQMAIVVHGTPQLLFHKIFKLQNTI